MTGFGETAGKLVLVTGGSGGIGSALVGTLAEAGYDIVFTFHKGEDKAGSLLETTPRAHADQKISSRRIDFTDRAAVEAFADELAQSQPLYGLIHNAGTSYDVLSPLINQDRAETLMQLNFWAMTRLVSATVRPMLKAKTGRIVGISSVAAIHGIPGNAAYAATKGAMASYVRTLAVEIARKNVTANCIIPGFVDTDLLKPYSRHREIMEKQIPAGRFARPMEIANLARYMLSPQAAYMTGALVPIDGGLGAAIAVQRYT
ncbi:3-oxoacyl-[acyl-carrier protein] reductase [hydrothermal vent metagenome]|uniref:3-oxoacyl-[acyl-carrier protein] reductase n=1 Tax=hydrothermal vent metagenome TaxID=652676 RepID=A0A3B0U2B6_9ZZZZ